MESSRQLRKREAVIWLFWGLWSGLFGACCWIGVNARANLRPRTEDAVLPGNIDGMG